MIRFIKQFIAPLSPLRLCFHRSKALLAATWYRFPAKDLTAIGITGTDGKTTTVGMIAHILNAAEKKTGAISTAFFQMGTEIYWNSTQKTSPSPFVIQRFLRRLVNSGYTHAVIECSSHGLLQGRVSYIYPTIAGITNISPEHLDYHGSMSEYVRAKSLLFSMLQKDRGVKILNADDQTVSVFRAIPTESTIEYSTKANFSNQNGARGFWMSDTQITKNRIEAALHTTFDTKERHVSLPMSGKFNLSNALCALAACHATGVSTDVCVDSLRSFKGIPGRMESIDVGQNFATFVDFTVTPKSYESTLSTLRSQLLPASRLLVLAGSCGDRMKEKRPIIGSLLAKYADISVVTNEDPYTEDPEAIIDAVISGMPSSLPVLTLSDVSSPAVSAEKFCVRVSDRLEGIRFILKQARVNDIVIFCGKGADITMMTKSGQIPWNEREIVRRELLSLA